MRLKIATLKPDYKYGFAVPLDNPRARYFFHATDLVHMRLGNLFVGQEVEADIVASDKGPRIGNVRQVTT